MRGSADSRCCAAGRCRPIAVSCCIGGRELGLDPQSLRKSRSPPRATCWPRWHAVKDRPTLSSPSAMRAGMRATGAEILENAWLSVPADESVVFDAALRRALACGRATARHRPDPASALKPDMPEPATPSSPWIVLAFDFGLKRIGIASGDSITRQRRGPDHTRPPGRAARLGTRSSRSSARWRPAIFVVGAPYNSDGTPGALTEPAREFARGATCAARLPVELMDERWSSLEAAARLKCGAAERTARAAGAESGHGQPRRPA